MKRTRDAALAIGLAIVGVGACWRGATSPMQAGPSTKTPIKHLVVIFGENISFDHYFGTYPSAANPPGDPRFTAVAGTPVVNGLTGALLTANPNQTNPLNGADAANPFRLLRTQAATSDQSHDYTREQRAYDGGKADLFPKYTGIAGTGGTGAFNTRGMVMGYFDGNTVTALWSYAQHFAMNDNSYGDQYGPSTPGAIDLVSGQTNGVVVLAGTGLRSTVNDGQGGKTLIGDPDPVADSCSTTADRVRLSGPNIGDLLNAAGVSWGWFQGGFNLGTVNPNGTTGCKRSTYSEYTRSDRALDYVTHHEPFQYYASTANPKHRRPSSLAVIGSVADSANHQYDLEDFFAAVGAGNFPSVSYLKAAAYQDAHAGNSDPLDEQHFITRVINFLEQQADWGSTAVIIAYDDSDGWYDHQMAPIGNASFDSVADQLSGPGACGAKGKTAQLRGPVATNPVNGRCGPGTRQPFLIVSPWAKANFVDHTLTTQSSILRFIEDNWVGGKRLGGGSFDAQAGSIRNMFDFKLKKPNPPLYLDTLLGTVTAAPAKAAAIRSSSSGR